MLDRNSPLWEYLSIHQKELLEDGEHLFAKAKNDQIQLHDYSFLVFPYAKCYEGFLKKLFFDLGFIDEATYQGSHFRIGLALNPSLEPRLRHISMYDKLIGYCGSRDLANNLWHVWKKGRNLLFHYFPHNINKITLWQAEKIRDEILSVMNRCLTECKIKNERGT